MDIIVGNAECRLRVNLRCTESNRSNGIQTNRTDLAGSEPTRYCSSSNMERNGTGSFLAPQIDASTPTIRMPKMMIIEAASGMW